MIPPYKAVCFPALSCKGEARFVIIDVNTGGIIDDAQGYGYKSKMRAYRSFGYLQARKKRVLRREAHEARNH
ncbi:hypothetical protein [Enterococcus gallinarum]|uniref:hypothetical protein n=1 Tax=Enterococcus gallinarum TaxID=1353 RepID=UPI00288FB016|nr:hypothetical protein [Enterococcus gallinarum]MDT2680479.1 hypothetical protein [Enterococcus gallinarum]MDT2683721.1 hypothetical protein [Enterococcus gallinarum]